MQDRRTPGRPAQALRGLLAGGALVWGALVWGALPAPAAAQVTLECAERALCFDYPECIGATDMRYRVVLDDPPVADGRGTARVWFDDAATPDEGPFQVDGQGTIVITLREDADGPLTRIITRGDGLSVQHVYFPSAGRSMFYYGLCERK